MKRMLILSLVAVGLLALGQQRASAWCNFNFSTGLNTSIQAGGCRLLWGLVETSPGPNPNGGNNNCQAWPNMVPDCGPLPEQVPAPKTGDGKTGFFRNFFQSPYQNQYGQYNYPNNGYYQYPNQGFYQYPAQGYPQAPQIPEAVVPATYYR